eukprot:17061-Eustigmatos_ZCMA.PRE.1
MFLQAALHHASATWAGHAQEPTHQPPHRPVSTAHRPPPHRRRQTHHNLHSSPPPPAPPSARFPPPLLPAPPPPPPASAAAAEGSDRPRGHRSAPTAHDDARAHSRQRHHLLPRLQADDGGEARTPNL